MLPSLSVDHSYCVWLRHQLSGLLSDYLLTLTLIDEHLSQCEKINLGFWETAHLPLP